VKRKKIPSLAPQLASKLLILLVAAVNVTARGPEPGQSVPVFSLPDQNGVTRSFANLKGANGLMLVFYRSADW
jgi:hypothetical protein